MRLFVVLPIWALILFSPLILVGFIVWLFAAALLFAFQLVRVGHAQETARGKLPPPVPAQLGMNAFQRASTRRLRRKIAAVSSHRLHP